MRYAIALGLCLLLAACDGGDSNSQEPEDVGRTDSGAPECVDDTQCDDGDFCTVGSCQEGACQHTPRDCDDGLFCTGVEVCDSVEGACVATDVPVVDDGIDCTIDECNEQFAQVTHLADDSKCDDGDPCTDDQCGADGCKFPLNSAPCDDGDPCTEDDLCLDGSCAGQPKNCDDGAWCNGLEACHGETGECQPGTAPALDDGVNCTEDSCDEETDEVLHIPVHASCDDFNPCTDDTCNSATGCVHDDNMEPCDDGKACTVADTCFQGLCYGTSKACDDGLFCNGTESCEDDTGECLPGTPPKVDDGIDCTADSCDDLLDEVIHVAQDGECDDGDTCTDDLCDPDGGCYYLDNTSPCSDADPCTVDDTCAQGLCLGVPKNCSDDLFCNGEESCDPETGVCLTGPPPAIDDGVDCTQDSCDEESDQVINAPADGECDDANPCTDDLCDGQLGCLNSDNTSPCDDGLACTIDDQCANGLCAGEAVVCDDGLYCNGTESCDLLTGDCLAGEAPETDDDILCTVDSCDEDDDVVVHEPDSVLCDDDNPCTDDLCDAESGCSHLPNALKCDDGLICTLEDACKQGECVGLPKVCSNGVFCDGLETCDPSDGTCVDGTPPVVDDEISCTADSCDEENDVIVHAANDNLCNDENLCTDDACDIEVGCIFTPNTVDCDDNNPCTNGDVCNNSACQPGAWVCEDCTNDVDDNGNGSTDCCDALCSDLEICQQEVACGDSSDNDCDTLVDCADIDCHGTNDCGPYPEPGDLVITEIMKDPDTVSDALGEWFEITNVSETTFDLRFLVVADLGTNEFIVEESLTIAPEEYMVFARNSITESNGGVAADYGYSNFLLSNSQDSIVLSANGVIIDSVTYDTGATFPDPTGATLQLSSDAVDAGANDDGTQWCVAREAIGPDLDFGTPGQPNTPCYELDCSDELDEDLDGLTDCDDEDCAHLEGCGDDDADGIFNRDDICPGFDDTVDGDNDDRPDGCEIDWAGKVLPPSGSDWDVAEPLHIEVKVFQAGVTPLDGAPAGIKGTMSLQISGQNGWTESALAYVAEGSDGADVFRGTLPALSVPPGLAATVSLDLAYVTEEGVEYPYDGPTIVDLAAQPQPFVYVASGSAPPPGAGDLVITEIMKDPEHIPDDLGEWFEVLVLAETVVDLKGVLIKDDGTNAHTVMVSVFGMPGQYMVLGSNGNWAENGEIVMSYVYEGFALGNNADEVLLYFEETLIDGVSYDAGATFPDPAGASLALSPEALDVVLNDDGGNWCAATQPSGSGDLGTPGAPNSPCD